MVETDTKDHDLAADIRAVLDRLAENALRLREVLLAPYVEWADERPLGPPFDHDFRARPYGLRPLIARVGEVGGPTRHLEQVRQAVEDFDHLVHSYLSGFLSSTAAVAWRADVERAYGAFDAATQAADAWLDARGAAKPAPRPGPTLALLDENDCVTLEQLADALGVGYEQARRRAANGEFGDRIRVGRRKLVRSALVKRALGLADVVLNEFLSG